MKRNAFTLIELLAVIVILAIIALISIPLVLNTIDKAKEGAAKSSTYSYVSEVETRLATYMLKNNGTSYATGEHTVSELKNILEVEVKGSIPTTGTVIITSGIVTSANLCIDNYIVHYNGKTAEVKGNNCNEGIVQIDASNINFTPSNSEWDVSTVEEALNDLYQ